MVNVRRGRVASGNGRGSGDTGRAPEVAPPPTQRRHGSLLAFAAAVVTLLVLTGAAGCARGVTPDTRDTPRRLPAPTGTAAATEIVRGYLGHVADDYLTRAAALGYGGTVLIAQGEEILLRKGYGEADRARHVPNTPATLFNVESFTKQFVASAVLTLRDGGKLRVTDSVGKYFPEAPADKASITLHQLLTHTSGLPGSTGGDFEVISRDSVLARIWRAKLVSPPGDRWSYSNPGYTLLAIIVERVSGMPLEEYLRQRVFGPAGMTSTGYRGPPREGAVIARSYYGFKDLGRVVDHPWLADGPGWNLRGGGGMLSTVDDLHRYSRALERNQIYSADSRRLAETRHALTTRRDTYYGYAWFISGPPGDRLVDHGGDGDYQAEIRRYLDRDLLMVVLTNRSQQDRFARAIRVDGLPRLLTGRAFTVPPRGNPAVNAARVGAYAGTYVLPSGESIIVTADGAQLVIETRWAGAARLLTRLPPGTDTSRTPALVALGDTVHAMYQGIARSDFGPVERVLWEDLSIEDERAYWREAWPDLVRRHGAYRRTEMLGSRRAGATVDSYALVVFERGAELVRVQRNERGKLALNTDPTPALPPVYRFVPLSEAEFASFNFTYGEMMTIQFDRESAGRPHALRVRGVLGEETAVRARGPE